MILVLLLVLLVLVLLFTSIQTLYLESMRLRTRDLPSLQYFKSDLEERLHLRPEEGALTFSLWKHTCLVLFGVTAMAQVIDGGTSQFSSAAGKREQRVALHDGIRLPDPAVALPAHLGTLAGQADAFLHRRSIRDTSSGARAQFPPLAARHHDGGGRTHRSSHVG